MTTNGDWFTDNTGKYHNYRAAVMTIGGVVTQADGGWKAELTNFQDDRGTAGPASTHPTLEAAKAWVEDAWKPARRRAGLAV